MKKTNCKAIKEAYRAYCKSDMCDIFQAYDKPSHRKVDAYENCENLCKEYNGYDLKIVSKNVNVFTAGFVCAIEGKKAFVWITPCYDRYMELSDDTL